VESIDARDTSRFSRNGNGKSRLKEAGMTNRIKSKFGAQTPFYITAVLVLSVEGVFFLTYPINVARADASIYLFMLTGLKSNLIMADGYPWLLGHIMRLLGHVPRSAVDDPEFLARLLAVQHLAHWQ
jgi:hypothetical protein